MAAVQSRDVPRFLAAVKAMDPTYEYDAGVHLGAAKKPIFEKLKLAGTDAVIISQETRTGKPRVYETGAMGIVSSQPVAVFRHKDDKVPTVAVSRPDGSVEQLVTRGADVDQLRNPATIDALVRIVAAAPPGSALTSELISDVAAAPAAEAALKSVRTRLEMRAAAAAVGVTPPPLAVPSGHDVVAAEAFASIAANAPVLGAFKNAAHTMQMHPEETISYGFGLDAPVVERGTYYGAPVMLGRTTNTYIAPIRAWQVRDGALVEAIGDARAQILAANPTAHLQLQQPLDAALAASHRLDSPVLRHHVVMGETSDTTPYRVDGGTWFKTTVTLAPDGSLRWLSKDDYVTDPAGYLALYYDALARGDAETVRAMTPTDGPIRAVTVARALPADTPPAVADEYRRVFSIP